MPAPTGLVGATLYEAIDEYAERARQRATKEAGRVEAAGARRLKDAIGDMGLAEFGYSSMERIRDYWAARPEAKMRGRKGTGRPISLDTVQNQLRVTRRLVRWIDRAEQYKWQLPRHGLDALKLNLKRLETAKEVPQKRHGVQVFDVSQLSVIWKHATDFDRLLVLLGLNAAMAQAELILLRHDEIEGDPLVIKRVRQKSGVFGQFALWPETIEAIQWWRKVRPGNRELLCPGYVQTAKTMPPKPSPSIPRWAGVFHYVPGMARDLKVQVLYGP